MNYRCARVFMPLNREDTDTYTFNYYLFVLRLTAYVMLCST